MVRILTCWAESRDFTGTICETLFKSVNCVAFWTYYKPDEVIFRIFFIVWKDFGNNSDIFAMVEEKVARIVKRTPMIRSKATTALDVILCRDDHFVISTSKKLTSLDALLVTCSSSRSPAGRWWLWEVRTLVSTVSWSILKGMDESPQISLSISVGSISSNSSPSSTSSWKQFSWGVCNWWKNAKSSSCS